MSGRPTRKKKNADSASPKLRLAVQVAAAGAGVPARSTLRRWLLRYAWLWARALAHGARRRGLAWRLPTGYRGEP